MGWAHRFRHALQSGNVARGQLPSGSGEDKVPDFGVVNLCVYSGIACPPASVAEARNPNLYQAAGGEQRPAAVALTTIFPFLACSDHKAREVSQRPKWQQRSIG